MDHVLVTGGAGYVGSHACKALARAGFTPVSYDNLCRGHRWAVKWGPLEVGEIEDRARVAEVLQRYRPVAAMHFAAFAYAGESVLEPEKYFENNVVGSARLLQALRAGGLRHLVFSSTCAVYGDGVDGPITESAPLRPVSPYGQAKLAVEQMLAAYDRAYGLQSISLRYFNAAGADPDGQLGEVHDPETHLIPLVLDAAAGRRPRVQVFGDGYPTPDGTCVRDYVHVSDLADAHVLALRHLLDRGAATPTNLGTGRGSSVREIIAAVEAVTGRTVPFEVVAARGGDPPSAVADAARARTVLGWQPQRSDLKAMIASAWRWAQRGEPPQSR